MDSTARATAPLAQWRAVCQEQVTDSRGRQRLKGCWWNILFSRHISIYLTILFVSLGITANQVTGLMLIVGFSSFVCAVPDNLALNIASLLLFLLFNILDCSDGEVARWTKKCSSGGIYLDYAAHVMCNAPLMAGPALHAYLTNRESLYGLAAFLTLMLALWAYYFKLIVPALFGREARKQYGGDHLSGSKTLVDAIRIFRSMFADTILAPMLVIGLVITSHVWETGLLLATCYGLLSSVFVSGLYFVTGYAKAKRLGSNR